MRGWWTIGRASGIGFTAGLLALLLWPFHDSAAVLRWPFAAALGIAGLCGASILLLALLDTLFRRRGQRMRPVRVFDFVFGAALVALSLLELGSFRGQLPAETAETRSLPSGL
jgi:hypothetical protein